MSDATNSYTSDFLTWWKDFWVSTPGMNPSQESKAAAWAGWQAGRAREQSVWGSCTGPNWIPVEPPEGHTPHGKPGKPVFYWSEGQWYRFDTPPLPEL